MSFGGCGFGAGNGNGRPYNGINGSNGCNAGAGCPGQVGQMGQVGCGPQGNAGCGPQGQVGQVSRCGAQGQGQGCPPCCPPIVIKTPANCNAGQCVVFQLPPVNVVCEIPPQQTVRPPRMCCVPIIVCEEECTEPQGSQSLQVPIDYCCNKGPNGNGNGRCGPRPY